MMENNEYVIKEWFIQFVDNADKTVEDIFQMIIEVLRKHSHPLDDLRAQA